MKTEGYSSHVGFVGKQLVATGNLHQVVGAIKAKLDRGASETAFIFDNQTGEDIEIDFRGSGQDVLARLPSIVNEAIDVSSEVSSDGDSQIRPRAGRPKLGVVAREITLLPRQWDWLAKQPGGASVTLRKLVEEARRANQHKDRARHSLEVAHRFMYCLAGDCKGFEEASRALFAKDFEKVLQICASWPKGIRLHAQTLVEAAERDEAQVQAAA